MTCCDKLIHPFQSDTGTSQRQRVVDELLGGTALIDGRKLADLLQYISQLSRHINFYDAKMAVSDWQPFFSKSLPFMLARIIKYDKGSAEKKFKGYEKLFHKRPSRQALQLITHFIYYQVIHPVNRWQLETTGTELPAEKIIEKIIRDKLQEPVKKFICLCNTAVQTFRIKKIDFNKLQQNDVWELKGRDIRENSCFESHEPSRRKRLIALGKEIAGLFPGMLDTLSLSASGAELSLDQSLLPLKEEFREHHSPHLALFFAFLKLFTLFQNDLNSFTKKHLDFFYKDVLRLTPRSAVPDQAHILFEIQNQLDKYPLSKSVKVKDGKDAKKAEINFGLEDEIVVNKTAIAETKTLFLNNRSVYDTSYIEGVYAAPNARMADGVETAFTEDPKNWYTLGNKYSKYLDPERKSTKPYPTARLGFILTSPVLLLNEGTRTVTIQVACKIDETVCDIVNSSAPAGDPCCNGGSDNQAPKVDPCAPQDKDQVRPSEIINMVSDVLSKTWHHITPDLIEEAIKKGISVEIGTKIKRSFLTDNCYEPIWCKDERKYLEENTVWSVHWENFLSSVVTNPADQKILNELFPGRRAFKIYFSGEKSWIDKGEIVKMSLANPAGNDKFVLKFIVKLGIDMPAVTFYDKDNLKEDFNTTAPLVKIELDPDLGIILNKRSRRKLHIGPNDDSTCCLEREDDVCVDKISLYQFFRYARVVDKLGTDPNGTTDETRIDVEVCGIKKFLVKNSESIQNSGGPVYVFGTTPEVIDFDAKTLPPPLIITNLNLVGPSLYLGNAEIFYKKWNRVYINFDWKDKPTNFNDYYSAYFKLPGGAFGLDENRFLINLSIHEQGGWVKEKDRGASTEKVVIQGFEYFDRPLFHSDGPAGFCDPLAAPLQTILLDKSFFNLHQEYLITKESVTNFGFDAPNGFMKINLQVQDFCHKMYAYVLARQMMALGKLPDAKIEDAVYYDLLPAPHLIVFSTDAIKNDLQTATAISGRVRKDVNDPNAIKDRAGGPANVGPINAPKARRIRQIVHPNFILGGSLNLTGDVEDLFTKLTDIAGVIDNSDKFQAVIPNPPWTPIANNINLDYTATAKIEDMELIHLYPYAGTYKSEEITLEPTLFPTFCDEGNLFIGLDKLVPGSNLNILFQLAEATADSESEREELSWYYLDNNVWKTLRKGFEVLKDATEELTTSGIVKLAMPENMTKGNTILPKDFHWIRVSIPRNNRTVAETTGLHTQAILTIFTNDEANDRLRLNEPLVSGSIGKLTDADPQVKTVTQPYDSFGGREPEAENHFYLRASEVLRHKGRAIQKWDYERLVLENFAEIFKTKCINHSFALDAKKYKIDFPMAPGYVILAVIPDLTKLKAGNSFEPKAPVSLLERIEEKIRKRTSPFVRLRAMNPRYEKIDFQLEVKLNKGRDENYYKQKLSDDVRKFLAPWSVGEYSKLSFGQSVNRSDMLRFLEGLEYLDYIIKMNMRHEDDKKFNPILQEIRPHTPRSILLAGEINVCIKQDDCDTWGECYETKYQQSTRVKCCPEEPKQLHDFCKPIYQQ